MNMVRFRLLLVTLVALFTLAPVTTAFAAPPEILRFHDEGSFVAADCGDFLVLEDFIQDITVTTFFNREGNPIRAKIHINFDGILTHSVTGTTLRDPGHWTVFQDLQTGTEAVVGMVFAITVPGKGIAVLDAGKIVFDTAGNVIFEGGPHQFFDEGSALICAAFS